MSGVIEEKGKAYHVQDKDSKGEEAHHEIVFANTPSKAKYASEAYSFGTDWTSIIAHRAPAFDQYAGRKIPTAAYIAEGWLFECDECGNMTSVREKKGKVFCNMCFSKDSNLQW